MADWTSRDPSGLEFSRAGLAAPGPSLRAERAAPRARTPSAGFNPWRLPRRHPIAAAVAALLALGLVVLLRGGATVPPAAPLDAHPVLEAPAWSPIIRPVPTFVLDTPLFPPEQVQLAARRHNPGGGREETFSLGRPGTAAGFARVVVYRTGSEAGTPGTLFLELARRAAEDGFALLRSVQQPLLASKFGPLETAEVELAGAGGRLRCTAWRIVADEEDLRVTGWLCPPEGEAVQRTTLACLVDRLQLSPAQTDAGLRTLFKDAERRRTPGCPAPKPVSAARRPA